MRHRSSRPLLDLWRRPSAVRPLHRGIAAVGALALAGSATGLALAAQGDDQATADRPAARAALPTAADTSVPDRSPAPSRSTQRMAGDTPTPSPTPSAPTTSATPSPLPVDPTTLVPSTSDLPRVGTSSQPAPSSSGSAPTRSSSPSDTTPPQTVLSTLSDRAGTWVLAVRANEAATFQCSLDGGAFTSCASRPTFTGLRPGHHTVDARATDTSGNTDPTPAEATIKVTGAGSVD